jgi:uncharacterized repeat protein (TIGR04052 family)
MLLRPLVASLAIGLAHAPALADMDIAIPFVAEIGGAAFSCAATYPLGATQTEAGLLDFRLFVSHVALVSSDGAKVPVALTPDGIWQADDIALLDFEDGSGGCRNGTPQTNTTLRGRVPDGDYVGLVFEIGVPFAANHRDPTIAASPLNLTAMFWNWQAGYKFVKLEVSPVAMAATAEAPGDDTAGHGGSGHGGRPGDWYLHIGSTGCQSFAPVAAPEEACGNPNRITVALDDFVQGQSVAVVDPARVLAATDLTANATGTSPGCMASPDDADCAAVMPRLGLPFGGAPAGPQMLVTLR